MHDERPGTGRRLNQKSMNGQKQTLKQKAKQSNKKSIQTCPLRVWFDHPATIKPQTSQTTTVYSKTQKLKGKSTESTAILCSVRFPMDTPQGSVGVGNTTGTPMPLDATNSPLDSPFTGTTVRTATKTPGTATTNNNNRNGSLPLWWFGLVFVDLTVFSQCKFTTA